MSAYRIVTYAAAPLLNLWLAYRRSIGKENAARLPERKGFASHPRPKGKLLWIHAASVGEANAVEPMLQLLAQEPGAPKLLLTTGTVTSAELMARKLPSEIIHQFSPIDTPQATARFMRHWQPDIALFVESELWPNLIEEARKSCRYMAIINGRMSHRSYLRWKRPAQRKILQPMLAAFDAIFAQSEGDAMRYRELGAVQVTAPGNLKFDAPPLACNEEALTGFRRVIGTRPCWIAASFHPDEDDIILQARHLLAKQYPTLLTLLVPRHSMRGDAIAQPLRDGGFTVAQRSKNEPLGTQTQFYLADTMGELGLFYRLAHVAFIGGSLAHTGGQNPLEAIRLGCAVLAGPYTHHFDGIYQGLETQQALIRVRHAQDLAEAVSQLWSQPQQREQQVENAQRWLSEQQGATHSILQTMRPLWQGCT